MRYAVMVYAQPGHGDNTRPFVLRHRQRDVELVSMTIDEVVKPGVSVHTPLSVQTRGRKR